MELHKATISFYRTSISRKHYGEVRINGDLVYKTEPYPYKKKAVDAVKKNLSELNKTYGWRLAEPLEIKENGVIQRRYTPERNWDNTCYTLTPEEYEKRKAQEQAIRGCTI